MYAFFSFCFHFLQPTDVKFVSTSQSSFTDFAFENEEDTEITKPKHGEKKLKEKEKIFLCWQKKIYCLKRVFINAWKRNFYRFFVVERDYQKVRLMTWHKHFFLSRLSNKKKFAKKFVHMRILANFLVSISNMTDSDFFFSFFFFCSTTKINS